MAVAAMTKDEASSEVSTKNAVLPLVVAVGGSVLATLCMLAAAAWWLTWSGGVEVTSSAPLTVLATALVILPVLPLAALGVAEHVKHSSTSRLAVGDVGTVFAGLTVAVLLLLFLGWSGAMQVSVADPFVPQWTALVVFAGAGVPLALLPHGVAEAVGRWSR